MNRELIERIDELMSLRTRLKCGEYDGNDIMQAWLAIDELLDCKAALSQQSAVTDDMRYAVRFAPSSAHWSERLLELFGPDARKGIDALEAQLREALSQQEAEPVAYTWDDNNGIGGSPNPRVAFEYPQYFTGPVKKLYSVPPKPAPLPQPVASAPQDVEEFISANAIEGDGYNAAPLYITVDDLRAWMAGHARVQNRVIVNLVDALRDARSGMRCIRQTHGDLYGIGFDRVEKRSTEALRDLESCLLTASKEKTE